VSLHWDGYYWYVFNLADVWISLAVALLLSDLIRPQKTPD
jgi:lipoprotein signal peptidase